MGLEGPLSWLADQLEARDRARMTGLWEMAPDDWPRLERCVAAYERRYPRSNRSYAFRGQLKLLGQESVQAELKMAPEQVRTTVELASRRAELIRDFRGWGPDSWP